MTGILSQLDMQPSAMALGIAIPRIPGMAKSRAYSRQTVLDKIQRKQTHFIREWRERKTDEFPKGMSQEVLSERSGVSVSSISAYERGDNDPSLEALQKLADVFGVPRGMLTDVDPSADPQLWEVYLRANKEEREALGRMAASFIKPTSRPRRR